MHITNGWRLLLLGGGLASACGSDSGEYSATLADIAPGVLAYVKVDESAETSVSLKLLRWFDSSAFGWAHCPVIHARAEVDGLPLELVDPGGWISVSSGGSGSLFGSGGYCRNIHFVAHGVSRAALDHPSVVFRASDESGELVIETHYLTTMPMLALDSAAPVLVPGASPVLRVLPDPAIVRADACSIKYLGELSEKTPIRQRQGFTIQNEQLLPTAAGYELLVPPGELSHGTLSMVCGARARIHPAYSVWPARVSRCDGAKDCAVERWDGPSTPTLEVSVSNDGTAVAPDPRADPFDWSSCGFEALSDPLAPTHLDGHDGCTGGAFLSEKRMSLGWGSGANGYRIRMEIDGIDRIGPAASLPARLHSEVLDATCEVSITEVWLDSHPDNAVVEGLGSCPSVPSFRYRAPVLVNP